MNNPLDDRLHSIKSTTEGSGEVKGLSEKMKEEEKQKTRGAIKDVLGGRC